MEGVEIVIKPIHLERFIYAVVIIALAVLLIIKWDGGACDVETDKTAGTTVTTTATINQTNQTLNATQGPDLCADGIKNQDETDIDCGGSKCAKCAEFKGCNVNADCTSAYCHQNIKCMTPTCDDGIKNKDELTVDCGGYCTATKGEFFYDGACHKEVKPQYSGKVNVSIEEVKTSVNDASGESFAKIDNVTFKVINQKEADIPMTAYLFLRTETGMPYYTSSATGEEIPKKTISLPLLALGASYTEEVVIATTLTETEPDENYRVVIEIRDDDDNLLDDITWTNP